MTDYPGCPTCSNTKLVPLVEGTTSRAQPCPNCGHEPWATTIMTLCLWHEEHKTGFPVGDVKWAQRYLDDAVREALITAEQAADIRRACGWCEQLRMAI